MKVKDFFRLALKLIAIFYVIEAIYLIIGNIQYFVYAQEFSNITMIWNLLTIVVPIVVYYFIFMQSDKLVKFLKIDKGFEDQKVHFGNLTSNEILKIAFILFGMLMIIWGLPSFLINCFYAFKYSAEPHFFENDASAIKHDYLEMTKSAIYILMGYLMVTNYKRIANWFDK